MRVVVIGAGYGGVRLARALGRRVRRHKGETRIHITLITNSPYHVIKTELHTLASGTIDDPGDVQVPVAGLFDELPVQTIQAEVVGIEPDTNRVTLDNGEHVQYDQLAIALGASPEYFGIPGLSQNSTTIGEIGAALRTRRLVDGTLRNVAAGDAARAEIVIGGGGLTGIELAGELAWVLRCRYARSGAEARVAVTIVEAAPSLMPGLNENLGVWAKKRLEDVGVKVLTGHQIAEVTSDRIEFKSGENRVESLEYDLLVWSGGVRGNKMLEPVFTTDRKGRVLVDERLRVIAYPNVRVLGDTACVMGADGRPFPPTAQGAILQGSWIAEDLWNACMDRTQSTAAPYREHSKGVLASIGPEYGVGLLGKRAVRGRWVKWLKDVNNLRYLATIGAWRARKIGATRQPIKPSHIGVSGRSGR